MHKIEPDHPLRVPPTSKPVPSGDFRKGCLIGLAVVLPWWAYIIFLVVRSCT